MPLSPCHLRAMPSESLESGQSTTSLPLVSAQHRYCHECSQSRVILPDIALLNAGYVLVEHVMVLTVAFDSSTTQADEFRD